MVQRERRLAQHVLEVVDAYRVLVVLRLRLLLLDERCKALLPLRREVEVLDRRWCAAPSLLLRTAVLVRGRVRPSRTHLAWCLARTVAVLFTYRRGRHGSAGGGGRRRGGRGRGRGRRGRADRRR